MTLFFTLKKYCRTHQRSTQAVILALSAALVGFLNFVLPEATKIVEEQGTDLAWRLQSENEQALTPEQRINIIAIDERSIAEIGPWPWSRETMAQLSDALATQGATLQIYDMVLPESKPGDESLVAAFQRNNVVLGQLPDIQTTNGNRTGILTHPVSGANCSVTARFPSTDSFIGNAPDFSGISTGHLAPLLDSDGMVRHVPALICVEGKAYPSLALAGFMKATGSTDAGVRVSGTKPSLSAPQWLKPAQELELISYPGLSIPLDEFGMLRVDYSLNPDALRSFSAVDVLRGNLPAATLDGTWALVGYAAFGLVDIVPTPYTASAPGIEIQARVLSSLLDNQLPYRPLMATWLQGLMIVLSGALLLVLMRYTQRSITPLAVLALLLPLTFLGTHIVALQINGLWLGWLSPSLFTLLASSLLMLQENATVRFERVRVLENLSSYLPKEVAQEIAFTLPNSSVSAQRRSATLLVADLRNFARFTEVCPAEESATLLHYFVVKASGIIESHGGQLHELKGDGIIALWSEEKENAAESALNAAQALQEVITPLLEQYSLKGLEPLALGIGIEQGPVLIGSIGPANRRIHTLLGDTVTIALRIQGLTADLAQPILLGACVARFLPDAGLISQGSFLLDGLMTPHTLFAAPCQTPYKTKESLASISKPKFRVFSGGNRS